MGNTSVSMLNPIHRCVSMLKTSKLNTYKKNKKKGDIGIISSGFPSSLVDSIISDDVSHLVTHDRKSPAH